MTQALSGDSRRLNGVLVIDKPVDMSSARVVAIVKRLTGVAKVGHAGTLDPFATGVLVLCINQATKLARFWLSSIKTYEGRLCLGVETDTQDATGDVMATGDTANIAAGRIQTVMASFVGASDQAPPVFSALKHQGVPLYRLARRGTPVQKPPRKVWIHRLDIQEIVPPYVRFVVTCSAGTYVRTLCADIGKALGCGAHLQELRRTASGRFSLADAVTLPELETLAKDEDYMSRLIEMSETLPDMATIQADKSLTDKLKYGIMITSLDVPAVTESPYHVKVIDDGGRLLSVLCYDPPRQRYVYCCSFLS